MGDLDAALPHAVAMRDLADRRGTTRIYANQSLAPITILSCLKGDWKAGREHSDRALEASPLAPQLLSPRVLLEHETGEYTQGEAYLDRLLEAMGLAGPGQMLAAGRGSMALPAVARITGVPGRLEVAEAAADAILSDQFVIPFHVMYANVGLALLAVLKGDQSAADKHHAYLLGQRGTMISTVISVDRLLGLLAQTMVNLDQAVAHFEDALAFCRRAGYRPELAWTCCDYADALHQRNRSEDRAKAVVLLGESLAISTELGMPPLMERVTERLERTQAQPPPAPSYPDGLTRREVEVLRLVATGKTDREIGEELIISFRTVGNHVRNILNKTNTTNRTEAATYAAHQGLT